MTQLLHIHPTHPQPRLILRAVESLQSGGVIVYPTSAGYAIGCQMGDKSAIEQVRRIRELPRDHNFTLMCRDLSEIATYARVDNATYRMIKAHTPGPYTFILAATKEVPRRLMHPKRKTIGIRVSAHEVTRTMLEALGEPFLSVSLHLPGEEIPLIDPEDIYDHMQGQVDVIIDAGSCGIDETSIIDFTSGVPELVRRGQGDVSGFGLV